MFRVIMDGLEYTTIVSVSAQRTIHLKRSQAASVVANLEAVERWRSSWLNVACTRLKVDLVACSTLEDDFESNTVSLIHADCEKMGTSPQIFAITLRADRRSSAGASGGVL